MFKNSETPKEIITELRLNQKKIKDMSRAIAYLQNDNNRLARKYLHMSDAIRNSITDMGAVPEEDNDVLISTYDADQRIAGNERLTEVIMRELNDVVNNNDEMYNEIENTYDKLAKKKFKMQKKKKGGSSKLLRSKSMNPNYTDLSTIEYDNRHYEVI